VYVITAMANAGATSVTNTGARRMYQVEYAPAPPVTANAAVASKAGVNLTGNLQVIGYDQCTCKLQSGSYVARYNGGTCNNTTSSIYSAGVVDNPNNSETVVGPVGDQHGIQESIGANNWPASLNIDTLINSFKPGSISVATQSSGSWNLNNGTNILGPFPTTAQLSDPALIAMSGQVSYIGGSIQLGGSGSNTFPSQCQGACGSGVLIVDGDLTIHGGGFQWYGLILVRGTVTFQGGGSAGTNIYGAVIAGQDTNANTDTTLGGSVNIQLDKCAISNSMKARPLTYISSRELLY
jgi:hypothetical protein